MTATELYRRDEAALLRYARSITRNPDDASDALQSAWLKLLSAGQREPSRPLLFRVVHNEAVSILRRRRPAAALADDAPALAVDPGEQFVQREQAEQILRDLRQLPDGQRAALVMRELEDRDYDEIAVTLGVTQNNARQLVFAARTSIQEVESGRGLECERVRASFMHSDGRRLRRRTLRAHLRSCDACRDFVGERRGSRRRGILAWWPFGGASLAAGAAAVPATPVFLRGAATLVASVAAATGVVHVERPVSKPAAVVKLSRAGIARTARALAAVTPAAPVVVKAAVPVTVATVKPVATTTVKTTAPKKAETVPAAEPKAPSEHTESSQAAPAQDTDSDRVNDRGADPQHDLNRPTHSAPARRDAAGDA